MSNAVIRVDPSMCELVSIHNPGVALTKDTLVMIGDTPTIIILHNIASDGDGVGVRKAPLVLIDASTASSAGTADASAGNGIYLDTGDMGVTPGTGGTTVGTLIGVCAPISGSTQGNTASAFYCSFDASLFLAVTKPAHA